MTAVEICVECDIADCHHIRARRASLSISKQAGAEPVALHREWRSAFTVAVETLETECEHRAEGGHDEDASKMRRAATVIRSMLAAPGAAIAAREQEDKS